MKRILDFIGNIGLPEKSDFDRWEKELVDSFKDSEYTTKEILFITIIVILMFAIPLFLLWLAEYLSQYYGFV